MLGAATHNLNRPPLDKVRGEVLEGLGHDYVVVPLSKWADTPMWEEACRQADLVFKRKGKVITPTFNEATVLVQEYHGEDRVAFIFAHFGRKPFQRTPDWLYVPVVMRLTPPLKAHLVLTGRWPSRRVSH